MRVVSPFSMALRMAGLFVLLLLGEAFAEDVPVGDEQESSQRVPSDVSTSTALSSGFSRTSPLSERLHLTETHFEPYLGTTTVLDPQAALPFPLRTPGIGKTYQYSIGGRQGDHSLLFMAATMESSQVSQNAVRLPVNFGFAGLEYRYHGLFGGVIRPVVRFSGGAQSMYMPTDPGMFQMGFGRYAAAEAGLEIVYKGVGVGFTTGYQWVDEQEERTFHLPIPAKGRRKSGTDWSKLLNRAVKRIYLILE